MPTELTVANDLCLLQINHCRITFIPHRRQVTTGRMATTIVITFRLAAKDVIEVLLADHAKAIQHLVDMLD
jgi:hypothetical protein